MQEQTWSVRHKADREKMARAIEQALPPGGVLREPRGGREIVLRIGLPCGAFCYVNLDGGSTQPDTFVVTWNTRRRMAPAFGAVNSVHGQKATRVFHGFEALRAGLVRDAEAFADGSAYALDATLAQGAPQAYRSGPPAVEPVVRNYPPLRP